MTSRLGRYELRRELGRGGFGEVWLAHDTELDRDVALKLLSADDPDDVRRFVREAQTAAALDHPNVAAIYDTGHADGRWFIAMQFVDGTTIAKAPRSGARDLARLFRDAARGVAAAHEKGIVHRDLKPANMMVDRAGAVFVMDFGLARRMRGDRSVTQSGMLVGTPAYMSPEQARGERADARSDVWSLGATIYDLLGGRPPFAGDSIVELLTRVVHDDPPPLARVPADLSAIVFKCLEKEPARRYPTAAALADDLTCFLERRPLRARARGPLHRALRRMGRHLAVVGVLSCAAAILVTTLVLMKTRVSRTEQKVDRDAERRRLVDAVATARPLVYVKDADLRARFDEVEAAIAALDKVQPKTSEIWVALGHGRHLLGYLDGAADAFGAALACAPDDPAIAFALARVDMERSYSLNLDPSIGPDELGQMRALRDGAAARLERIVKEWEGAGEFDRKLARAYLAVARQRFLEVITICEDGMKRFADHVGSEDFWLILGAIPRSSKQEQIAWYTRTLARRPHYVWAYYMRGAEKLMTNDFDGAIADCSAALRLEPRHARALTNRAAAHLSLGNRDAARADLEAAIAADPAFYTAHLNLANHFNAESDETKALTTLIDRFPRRPTAYLHRAVKLAARERWTDALSDLDRSLELFVKGAPDRRRALSERARIRLKIGDRDGARADADALLKIRRDDPDARQILEQLAAPPK